MDHSADYTGLSALEATDDILGLHDDGPPRGCFRGVAGRMFGFSVPTPLVLANDDIWQDGQSYVNLDTDSENETETDVLSNDSDEGRTSKVEKGNENEDSGSGSDDVAKIRLGDHADDDNGNNLGSSNAGDGKRDGSSIEENEEREDSGKDQPEQDSELENEDESPEMEEHFKFVNRYRETLGGKPKPYSLDNAVGKYFIYSDDIEGQFGPREDGEPMEVRIFNPHNDNDRLVGLFDFGILEGIMRIGTNLDLLKEKWSNDEDRNEDTDEEDGETEESEEDEEEEERDETREVEALTTSRKRKAETEPSHPNTKKRRHSASLGIKNRSAHFLWRGRETGEGEIQLDFDNTVNIGHINFEDDACLTFSGLIDSDILGKGIEFNGYKVSEKSGRMDKTWSEYSEKQHRLAAISRWG